MKTVLCGRACVIGRDGRNNAELTHSVLIASTGLGKAKIKVI